MFFIPAILKRNKMEHGASPLILCFIASIFSAIVLIHFSALPSLLFSCHLFVTESQALQDDLDRDLDIGSHVASIQSRTHLHLTQIHRFLQLQGNSVG